MAGMNGVFHVEFGINETQLTRLLESRQYKEAEKLILENVSSVMTPALHPINRDIALPLIC